MTFVIGIDSKESGEKLENWINNVINNGNLSYPRINGYHTLNDGNVVIDFHDSDSAKMMKMLKLEGFDVS